MRARLGMNRDQIDFCLSVRTLSAVLDLILFTKKREWPPCGLICNF